MRRPDSDPMKTVDYSKSLEQLENDYWDEPAYDSYVATTCHYMRKKPLNDVTVEELRLAIGQGFSLNYLMPVAIGLLKRNILAMGDLYEGDLLADVISGSTFDYWRNNKQEWDSIVKLIEQHEGVLIDKMTINRIPDFMSIHKP